MLIYRFRIICAEHDGFQREIEIQPNQTFLDFHHVLVESAELLHCERASFFNTDKKYKKEKEISLKPEKRNVRKYDEDLDQVITESVSLPLMKNEKVKNYIEDPHQKLIYEFTGRDFFTFQIELYKITHADTMTSYPRCTKRVGELPKKAEQPVVPATAPAPAPRVSIPKPLLPPTEKLSKLDDIVEDESELAAIESELDGLLDEAVEEHDFAGSVEVEEHGDEYLYEGQADQEEEVQLDHLDDYEDIDNLDKRLSGFGRDQEDF